jgi:hypothetical protein
VGEQPGHLYIGSVNENSGRRFTAPAAFTKARIGSVPLFLLAFSNRVATDAGPLRAETV